MKGDPFWNKYRDFETNISYRSARLRIIFQWLPWREKNTWREKWELAIVTLPTTLLLQDTVSRANWCVNPKWWLLRYLGYKSFTMGVNVSICMRVLMCTDKACMNMTLELKEEGKTCWSPPIPHPACPPPPPSPHPEEVIGRVCFPEIKGCSLHPESWENLARCTLAVSPCNRPCHWHWAGDGEVEGGTRRGVGGVGDTGKFWVGKVGEMLFILVCTKINHWSY